VSALAEVSLEVRAHELLALTGSNGSGKSTLLSVLAGTHEMSSGQRKDTWADGSAISAQNGGARLRIAFVVQRSAVSDTFPLTARGAVQMGRWGERGSWRPLTITDRRIVADSIQALGLTGLESRPLASLSGGQRQRVFVAQGLAQQADVLLLDEPTVGLDDHARDLIHQAMSAEVRRGAAVVIATHDADVSAAADRVIHLAQGQIVLPAPTSIR
jgi:zinc/manganese transport system ATP-binding protein